MIIGEAPGFDEERVGIPFVGSSGRELDKMLEEAGVLRSSCFATNVLTERLVGDADDLIARGKRTPDGWPLHLGTAVSPVLAASIDRLKREIALASPRVILAIGNLALFALTGKWGIKSWRGSRLPSLLLPDGWIIPTYNPAAVMREWSIRSHCVRDMRRVNDILLGKQLPATGDFTIPGSPDQALAVLADLTIKANTGTTYLSVDIETRQRQIACTGIAWSSTQAICIPSLTARAPYFWCDETTEAHIVLAMRRLLTHPNVRVIGQNFLYDAQYFIRRWKFLPNIWLDTMIAHHATFNTLPKSLDFLSSIYCADHVYWKDESKDWDPKVGETQLWLYNCKDAVVTYEAAFEILRTAGELGTTDNVAFQHSLFLPALYAMHTGCPIDKATRMHFATSLIEEQIKRESEITQIVGHPLSSRSPKQLATFFYKDLALPEVKHRVTRQLTTNKDALATLEKREPLVIPITSRIESIRTLGVFHSTFACAPLDQDGKMRCSNNVAGTKTYRWSTSSNAFGSGTNLQNLPSGSKLDPNDAAYVELPNIRKLFIPPPNYTFFDIDLDRADLQVVVWEADDRDLKLALASGVDMHIFNAMSLFNFSIPLDELVETHPNYKSHKAKWARQRQLAKMWVHGTNYGGGPRTMAIAAGITVREAERMQAAWFAAHPGIKAWHTRTESMIAAGCITNIFGAKWYIFDRSDSLLPDALAWQPQSVVSRVINTGLRRVHDEEPNIHIILQVHDSFAGYFPTHLDTEMRRHLTELTTVTIPYSDPLIIPTGIKTSTVSWGDCK
jgi:DNA polymerase I-like protein with 3'-5' exonuclease and polymerase domains/uracil-DNA glycosylase